ncbi:hypothetical protein B0H98_104167 [Vreelandella songnenensis]|uniref:Uncharacterized protein n=1 Tax=Vreelandella songnenensis TaxID=1176243 RepID=A0A2T0V3W7_9GAMM|nr:hypothetical protein B0H98_104167 [Halomonas songnenensis]
MVLALGSIDVDTSMRCHSVNVGFKRRGIHKY